MSYSNDIKLKLLGIKIRSNCCRKAFIFGIVFGSRCAGTLNVDTENGIVRVFRSTDPDVASEVCDTMSKFFRADFMLTRECVCGSQRYSVMTGSPSIISMAKSSDDFFTYDSVFTCEHCRGAFLRGIFLSCGTVSNPKTSFHLELNVKDHVAGKFLREFLSGENISPSGKTRLYYKTAAGIGDFFAYIGASGDSFNVINLQIEKNIRGQENRITNCVTSNINRTVLASMRQLDAITHIIDEDAFDRLPKELSETADLRLKNPDATLTELALLHDPPITKSGLSHRLLRIIEISKELR